MKHTYFLQDVEKCLQEAEMNRLLRQADYIVVIEKSSLARCFGFNVDIDELIEIYPGIVKENRQFDKKVVAKWQDILFNTKQWSSSELIFEHLIFWCLCMYVIINIWFWLLSTTQFIVLNLILTTVVSTLSYKFICSRLNKTKSCKQSS